MKLMCKVATTPSLRDTSLQGEAFRLPLRGAVGNADYGVALPFSPYMPCTTPSLRDTSLQGEAFWLPLRGAVGNIDCGVAKKERPTVAPTNLSAVYIPLSYTRTALPNQV